MEKEIISFRCEKYIKSETKQEIQKKINIKVKKINKKLENYTCRMCGTQVEFKKLDYFEKKINCTGCRAMIAKLDKVYIDYNIDDFHIIVINIDMVGEFQKYYYRKSSSFMSYGMLETFQLSISEALEAEKKFEEAIDERDEKIINGKIKEFYFI